MSDGGGKRLRMTLSRFHVELIKIVADARSEDQVGESVRSRGAWTTISREAQRALAYDDERRGRS